jgi:IrrE N-terminal-like domain
MSFEGLRLARMAAIDLIQELELDGGPSPIDKALQHLRLEQTLVTRRAEMPFPEVPKNVRGILDAREAAIYVLADREARQRWIGSHEIGHYAIPEHNLILQFCSEWDLSPAARKQLECEANEFAATYLFQGRRFIEECLSSRFSLEMLRNQAQAWSVSLEAAFRRFAEEHPQPVALLVCQPIELKPAGVDLVPGATRIVLRSPSCSGVKLRYFAASARFRRERPHVQVGQVLDGNHAISRAVAAGEKYYWLSVEGHGEPMPASMFFNGYDVLVLVGIETAEHRIVRSAIS